MASAKLRVSRVAREKAALAASSESSSSAAATIETDASRPHEGEASCEPFVVVPRLSRLQRELAEARARNLVAAAEATTATRCTEARTDQHLDVDVVPHRSRIQRYVATTTFASWDAEQTRRGELEAARRERERLEQEEQAAKAAEAEAEAIAEAAAAAAAAAEQLLNADAEDDDTEPPAADAFDIDSSLYQTLPMSAALALNREAEAALSRAPTMTSLPYASFRRLAVVQFHVDVVNACPNCPAPFLAKQLARQLPCGHICHEACAVAHLSRDTECPACHASCRL
jgi:hypothetical protein